MTKCLGKKPPIIKDIPDVNVLMHSRTYGALLNVAVHQSHALIEAANELDKIREYYPKSILAREGWLPKLAEKLRISAGVK